MTTQSQTEALKLALEALQDYVDEYGPWSDDSGAQYVLRVGKEALMSQSDGAQPEQRSNEHLEPVATFDEVWDSIEWGKWRMEPIRELCRMIISKTTHPQRTWVGLTDEDFAQVCQMAERGNYLAAFQRIQTKLKDKNA